MYPESQDDFKSNCNTDVIGMEVTEVGVFEDGEYDEALTFDDWVHVFCIIRCSPFILCVTDSEPGRVFWGADEEISDGGVPRVIVYGYDGLPMHPALEDKEDDEEEEEHLASADSSAIPVVDPVPSTGDTEAFKTDEYAPTPRPPHIRTPFAQTQSSPCLTTPAPGYEIRESSAAGAARQPGPTLRGLTLDEIVEAHG
ncbi:hypothetical protein Tco_1112589 [Tanacetum coccineum]|uniref:Uncharacterized protein n=1 Tax=Tanacetum coccineum TaxID=301880 RepID=A0ABQ5IQB4_9ASTR